MSNCIVRYQDFLYNTIEDDCDAVGLTLSNPDNLSYSDSIEVAFTKPEYMWYALDDMDFDRYLSSVERHMLCDFCCYLYKQGFKETPSMSRYVDGFILCTFERDFTRKPSL